MWFCYGGGQEKEAKPVIEARQDTRNGIDGVSL